MLIAVAVMLPKLPVHSPVDAVIRSPSAVIPRPRCGLDPLHPASTSVTLLPFHLPPAGSVVIWWTARLLEQEVPLGTESLGVCLGNDREVCPE